MHQSEPYVLSFVVKLWFEKNTRGVAGPTWHGYITHVPSGRRQYFKDLSGVKEFIEPYLEGTAREGGGLPGRVRRWLRRVSNG